MSSLISVVIPCYNISLYIDQCILSLLQQSYRNIEVIVVNDGSTDDFLFKIEKWQAKDSRVKIVDKQNAGLSEARNSGLKMASGDYIAYVDGDDYVAAHYIDSLFQAIKSSEADFSVCGTVVFHDGSSHMEEEPETVVGEYSAMDALAHLFSGRTRTNIWNKLFKIDVAKKVLFTADLTHEDMEFSVRACLASVKVVYIQESLYFYRKRDGSILSTYRPNLIKHRFLVTKMIEENLLSFGVYKEFSDLFFVFLCKHVFFFGAKDCLRFSHLGNEARDDFFLGIRKLEGISIFKILSRCSDPKLKKWSALIWFFRFSPAVFISLMRFKLQVKYFVRKLRK